MLLKLLGLPLSIPAAGIKFCFQQIADMAETELYDEDAVREQFLLLQLQFEEGEIEEDDFVVQEAELMARLREIRERKEQAAREYAEEVQAAGTVVSRENRGVRRIQVEADLGESD